jgi:hypothetical protein
MADYIFKLFENIEIVNNIAADRTTSVDPAIKRKKTEGSGTNNVIAKDTV